MRLSLTTFGLKGTTVLVLLHIVAFQPSAWTLGATLGGSLLANLVAPNDGSVVDGRRLSFDADFDGTRPACGMPVRLGSFSRFSDGAGCGPSAGGIDLWVHGASGIFFTAGFLMEGLATTLPGLLALQRFIWVDQLGRVSPPLSTRGAFYDVRLVPRLSFGPTAQTDKDRAHVVEKREGSTFEFPMWNTVFDDKGSKGTGVDAQPDGRGLV